MANDMIRQLTAGLTSGTIKSKSSNPNSGTDIRTITQGLTSGAIKSKASKTPTYTPPFSVTTQKTAYKPTFTSDEDRDERIKEINKELGTLTTQLSSPDFGLTDLTKMREANKRKESLELELKTLQNEKKYLDDKNKDTFFGQAESNYDVGELGQQVSKAWNDYLDSPTKEKREYAENLGKLQEQYQKLNKDSLDDEGLLRKSFAGYVPQLKDQIGASVGGAIAGGMIGGAAGAKVGATAGSGIYSYQTMRGAAFKALLESGVDEATARKAANDEAVISSLIEMADTGLDIVTFGGFGQLASAISSGFAKATAKNAVTKLGGALVKYGLNIAGEAIEEGAQEAVSIANQRRTTSGKTDGSLAGDALKTAGKAFFGGDTEARKQILEAAGEGAKISAVMGGLDAGVGGVTTTVQERQISNEGRVIRAGFGDDQLMSDALTYFSDDSDTYNTALKWSQEIKAGKRSDYTDLEIGQLKRMMQQDLKDNKILETKKAELAKRMEDQQKKADLAKTAEESTDPAEREYATAQLEHTEETVVSPTAQTLMDDGMKPDLATEQAEIIRKVKAGETISNKEAGALKLTNPAVRSAFTAATGVEVSDADARSASKSRKIIKTAAEVASQKQATEAAIKAQQQVVTEQRQATAQQAATTQLNEAIAAEEQSRAQVTSETPVQAAATDDGLDELRALNDHDDGAMGIYRDEDGNSLDGARFSVSKAKEARRKQAAKQAKREAKQVAKEKPFISKAEYDAQMNRTDTTESRNETSEPETKTQPENTAETKAQTKETASETKTPAQKPKTARERFRENIQKYTDISEYKADLDKRISEAEFNHKNAEGGSVTDNAKTLTELREEAVEYRNYIRDARIVKPTGATRITLQRLTNIGKKAGVKVVLSDVQDGSNGFYVAATKTLYLNANKATNQRMMTYYFAHELTHRAKDVNSDLVMKDLLNAAKDIKGSDEVTKSVQSTVERYKNFHESRAEEAFEKGNFAEAQFHTNSAKKYGAEQAREEVAADFFMEAVASRRVLDKLTGNNPKLAMRILDAISDFRHRNEKELRGDKAMAKLAVRLRESLIGAQTGVTEGSGDAGKRHSIDTMVEPLGLTYEKTDKGVTVFRDADGNAVENVTEEMVRDSALGAVIELGVKAGTITESDMQKQVQFFADLYNLMLETQDIDMIWAVSSAIGFEPVVPGPRDVQQMDSRDSNDPFAPYTKNSDPQYSTTVDFTTICLKTKAIIDVMSETMVRLKSGLSEDEIVNIVYKNVYEGGQPVPCPVCYVFSRWVGLGGLFDTMWDNQKKYADLDAAKDDIARLEKDIDDVIAKYTGKKKLTNTDAKDKVYKPLNKRKKALDTKQALYDSGKSDTPLTVAEQNELKAITADVQILDNWSWLHNVRMQDDYKPVPAEILFDINRGKDFAEQYPKAWKFRTTRGPAMGKAATPYAAEHLGQFIRGSSVSLGSDTKLGDQSKNPYNQKTENGQLSKEAISAWEKARNRVRGQNLLNGQRYQSTSDFRFEYVLDYLLTFVEAQAIGSKVQLYTKVPESVRMFAAVNAEVNLSLMPLGVGYDENDNLIFSSVTGMNAEDAFALSAEFDNVQPIMVGTSVKHIKLCMADDRITFIIPYHASGASEGRYKNLMGIVGESVKDRDDFSAYQTDNKKKKATAMQKAAYDLRLRILTGDGKKTLNLTIADKALLGSNPKLRDLYNRFWVEGYDPECYGVRLTGDQAKSIFPFEYWDKTSTIETADAQGRAFCDYCEMLGLHPRFSGWDSKGKYNEKFDFSKDSGYWKMLIDRSMYNRDGSYHEQKAIDVTNFTKDFLFRDEAVKGLVQPSQLNDPDAVSKITDKTVRDIEENRFSLDSDGKELTPEQQEFFKDSVVRDEEGRLTPVYHGTPEKEGNIRYSLNSESESGKMGAEEDPHYLRYEAYEAPEIDHKAWNRVKENAAQEKGLTDDEFYALDHFVGDMARTFTRIMLGEIEDNEFYEAMREEVCSAAKKFPRHKGRVFRNMGFATQEKLDAITKDHAVGAVITLKIPTSTSKNPNGMVLQSEHLFHLVIDGWSGCDISDSFSMAGQEEVIYLTGAKYRVDEVKQANDGGVLVYATEVSNNAEDRGEHRIGEARVGADFGETREDTPQAKYAGGEKISRENENVLRGVDDDAVSRGMEESSTSEMVDDGLRGGEAERIRYSIDPTTGYEEGSVQDRLLKLMNTVSFEAAVGELNRWAHEIREGNISAMPEEVGFVSAVLAGRPATPEEVAQNRDVLNEMIRKSGLMDAGENPARPVFLPKESLEGHKTSKFVRTVAEAPVTPDWMVGEIERGVGEGEAGFTYAIATDKAAMAYVEQRKRKSFKTNIADWDAIVRQGRGTGLNGSISKKDIALGEYLYTQAIADGDAVTATRLVAEIAAIGTQAGQAVQALRLLKKLTPAGQLYYIQKAVERLNRSLEERGKNLVYIDIGLAKEVMNAKTKEDLDAAVEKLIGNIAEQAPVTVMDKWNTWRYLAMLGNPRTHIRNILSNAIFAPVAFLKDMVGTAIESVVLKDDQRTKAMGWSKYSDFAKADFEQNKAIITGNGKQNISDQIRDRRQIFKAKGTQWIDKASKFNSDLMNKEDVWFLKPAYTRAMGQFLAAHNADIDALTGTAPGRALLEQARDYAIHEAQKATFRDASVLASALNRLENSGIAGKFIVGSLLPFKKTPINILKRGVEYSPVGLIDTVLRRSNQLRKGEISVNEYIDRISAGLTGTGIMAIGYFMAKEGMLKSSGGGDDKEDAFDELQGAQTYAIVIGDKSFTIDWMAPAAMPLFVGCEVFNRFSEDGIKALTLGELSDTMLTLAEPVFQLSMLDGLNSTLKAASYGKIATYELATNMLTSYISQGIPTILGQIARTVDGTRRTTYVDKNKSTPPFISRFVQGAQAKTPGLSQNLTPKLDAWGRTDTEGSFIFRALENFILPGYVSTMRTSPMEEELERLYKVTGASVLPQAAAKYFNVGGARYDLSADEWVTYQTELGQRSYDMLTDLVHSASYRSMTDTQKADAVKKIYEYAKEKAKEAAVSGYTTTTSWIAKADDLAKNGISVEDYAAQTAIGKDTSGQNTKDLLGMSWLSDTNRAQLIGSAYNKSLTGGNTFTDPNRSGYAYEMSADQVQQYTDHFDEEWQAAYMDLVSSTRYKNADLDTQAKMVDELKTVIAADTKKWMARQLRSEGVRSVKKD